MPNKIQEEIQRMITEFVWGRTISAMKIDDLSKEIDKGGRKVLNIEKRNEAIYLMWIREYLRMGENRPKWAYLTDEILRHERPKRAKETLEEIAKWNPFTQDWRPKNKAKHIPEKVQKAIKLAHKHRVEPEASRPDHDARANMPIWLHRKSNGEAARLYKKKEAKCLKAKHKTHYVHQVATLINGVTEDHKKTNFCTCGSCQSMVRLGCTHPHGCIEMAEKLINTIAQIWRPVTPNGQPRTRQAQRNPHPGTTQNEGELTVSNQTDETDLENSIRIFTDTTETTNEWEQDEDEQTHDDDMIVYTDGSCITGCTEHFL